MQRKRGKERGRERERERERVEKLRKGPQRQGWVGLGLAHNRGLP